jgi:hypothetical protein
MLDLLNATTSSDEKSGEDAATLSHCQAPLAPNATKRALIEAELRKDAGRSDHEIGRVCRVDHKTVGAARKRLGIVAGRISPPISPRQCPPPPGVVDEPKYDPFDPKEGDMVIAHQPAVAVYENTSGAIVIIQATADYRGEDSIILVRPENLDALIVALRKFLP